jgi:hypothetical protein
MSAVVSKALYERLAGDAQLAALLATYEGHPAIFTPDLAPDNADLPYISAPGEGAQSPFDTKTTRGLRVMRDIRVYASVDGSAVIIEQIAERVRVLLHRAPLTIAGYRVEVANVTGPTMNAADDAYGRQLTLEMLMQEI